MTIDVVGASVVDLIFDLSDNFLENKDKEIVLPFGTKIPAKSYTICFGGGGANLAVGLSKLGLGVRLHTVVSRDALASELMRNLEHEEGLHLRAHRVFTPTSTSSVFRVGSERTIVTAPHHFELPTANIRELGRFIHIGPLVDRAEELYNVALSGEPDFISFNPSKSLVEKNASLIKKILHKSSIIFLNNEEAHLLTDQPMTTPIKTVINRLMELGGNIVVVTDGERGAYAQSQTVSVFGEALKVHGDKTDATGAGDAFASGFVAGYLEDYGRTIEKEAQLAKAMKWGIANSASSVMVIGAQGGLLHRSAISKWTDHVKLSRF